MLKSYQLSIQSKWVLKTYIGGKFCVHCKIVKWICKRKILFLCHSFFCVYLNFCFWQTRRNSSRSQPNRSNSESGELTPLLQSEDVSWGKFKPNQNMRKVFSAFLWSFQPFLSCFQSFVALFLIFIVLCCFLFSILLCLTLDFSRSLLTQLCQFPSYRGNHYWRKNTFKKNVPKNNHNQMNKFDDFMTLSKLCLLSWTSFCLRAWTRKNYNCLIQHWLFKVQ
jgi:hypothetical protein